MERHTRFAAFTFLVFCFSVTTIAQTPQQVENASAFARLYGYVRYFHPSDEAASIDWNRFAIYGSQRVSESKNAGELQAALLELFTPIAPTIQIVAANEKASFDKNSVMVPDASNYKTIAWQHVGVGVGGIGKDLYKSLRTNRPAPSNTSAMDFAPATAWVDAKPLQGKEFIFRGRVKMISGDGQGQLWARVDKADKKAGFFDNMQDRPIKKREWDTYEIKGKIDPDAASIVFGIMLSGKGEVAFDDLSLQVKEGNEWKELYAENFNASEENKEPKGLSWPTAAQASYSLSVKKEAAEGTSFASIRSREETAGGKAHQSLFASIPKVGEYIDKKIGSGLRVMLPVALYGSTSQTFPVADATALQELKKKLAAIPATDISGDQLYTRLGSLSIAWNIFQHFYPYFDVVKVDWEAALREAVQQAYADKTAADFQKTLQRLTAKLKDGHVRVNATASKAIFLPGFQWEWVEDELVITHVGDSTLSLKRGDIVKKIDGRPANEYFEAIHPLISAGTKGWLDYRAATESLQGEKGSVIKLEVLQEGKRPAEVTATRSNSFQQYYAISPKEDSIKMLSDDVAYVNIDEASMETINRALPQLQKSRVIICDLRGYPAGNHGFLTYLLKQKDTSTRWMQVPHTIYPDRENIASWQYHGWSLSPSKTQLNAKVIFLTDGQAISYAESYMGIVEHYNLATIIGQPTAGANGNINPFSLPGGYNISWTGMRVVKHNGSPHHTVGIQPHIKVNKTIKGIREGRDEFLEKALEVARKPL